MTGGRGSGVAEVTLHGFAHGGSAVGRLPDGTVCFVGYAIPGERVRVRVVERRRTWARAELVEVIEPSPDRVDPPCPLFGPDLCGGCKLQHIAPRRQAALLGTVISDQIRRIGHLDAGAVDVVRPHRGDGLGYRQRARFAVDASGHLAFRRASTHDLIAVDDCPLLVPGARAALRRIAKGWRGAREVQMQVGTDDRVALAVTASGGDMVVPAELPMTIAGPGRRDRTAARGRRAGTRATSHPPHVSYAVAGRTYRAGATSFFQASVAAAEHLVGLVQRMCGATSGEHVLELYAGVGLLSAALAGDGARVTAVEASAAACRDARANTAGLDVTVVRADAGPGVNVTHPVDAVVLDPPRRGAGAGVMTWIAELAPRRVVYVSCDPATFARDAGLLAARGFILAEVVGVDQFTHTGHVELAAAFHRDGNGAPT